MIESLHELAKEIQSRGGKLYFFKGDNIDVLKSILRDNKIASIGMNFMTTGPPLGGMTSPLETRNGCD
jgi:deoxyribodipyrimidine photolyase